MSPNQVIKLSERLEKAIAENDRLRLELQTNWNLSNYITDIITLGGKFSCLVRFLRNVDIDFERTDLKKSSMAEVGGFTADLRRLLAMYSECEQVLQAEIDDLFLGKGDKEAFFCMTGTESARLLKRLRAYLTRFHFKNMNQPCIYDAVNHVRAKHPNAEISSLPTFGELISRIIKLMSGGDDDLISALLILDRIINFTCFSVPADHEWRPNVSVQDILNQHRKVVEYLTINVNWYEKNTSNTLYWWLRMDSSQSSTASAIFELRLMLASFQYGSDV